MEICPRRPQLGFAAAIRSAPMPLLDPPTAFTSHGERSRHVPAIVPLAPLVGVGTILSAAYALRAPIVGRALGWWLEASVRVRRVEFAPFCSTRRWTLQGVRVSDTRGTPLCSFEHARIGSKLVAFEAGGSVGRRRLYAVELSKPEIIAVFENILFTSSNWSRWGARFRNGNSSVVSETRHEPEDTVTARVAGPRVKLDVKGGLLLSIRYKSELPGGTRIINDVRLTDLNGVGDDLLSPRSTANLVEKLCSRAIEHASWFRFESAKARQNARAFSRNVLRRETRSMRALARIHIRRLRKNVVFADELLRGIPDMARFAEAAKQGETVLSHIEQWLKLVEKPSNDGRAESNVDDAPRQAVSGHELPPESRPSVPMARDVAADRLAPSPPPAPAQEYMELDEEWTPRLSPTSASESPA